MTMEQECRDHWYGPGWSKRRILRLRWRYDYRAMARLRRSQLP